MTRSEQGKGKKRLQSNKKWKDSPLVSRKEFDAADAGSDLSTRCQVSSGPHALLRMVRGAQKHGVRLINNQVTTEYGTSHLCCEGVSIL